MVGGRDEVGIKHDLLDRFSYFSWGDRSLAWKELQDNENPVTQHVAYPAVRQGRKKKSINEYFVPAKTRKHEPLKKWLRM